MVKGWADHCSSDEEDEGVAEQVVASPPEPEPEPKNHKEGPPPPSEEHPPPQQRERVYEYPSEPPFTAYVGNLAYSISDPDDLAAEVAALASEQLHASIKVVHARIMKDRNNNDRPRGFGYVEVETVDMLKQLMELNTIDSAQIAGRRVQFDTANQNNNGSRRGSHRGSNNRRGSENSVDGSKFRGGRFSNRGEQQQQAPRDPAAQRPSLKLKPRSKPKLDEEDDLGGSQGNIFGGAKARDETSWKERRNSDKQASTGGGDGEKQTRRDSNKSGRGGGRGGREGRGGRGGREGGRSERGSFREKKTEKKQAHAPAPKPVPPPEPEKAPPAKPKVTNAFAALAMDDSDSD